MLKLRAFYFTSKGIIKTFQNEKAADFSNFNLDKYKPKM